MHEILFETADFIALNKPAGVAVIPGRGEDDCILHQIAEQLGLPHAGGADPRIRVVHRLDKETSGVLLFAKHLAAQRHVSHQFQNNAVEKQYLALVRGKVKIDEGIIEQPIAPHPSSRDRMCVSKHGRAAVTHWRVEERFREITLLRLFPKTGKTHQIRVHLQHIGFPLLIDPLYNPPRGGGLEALFLSGFKRGYRESRAQPQRPLIARLTLHAERLRFLDLSNHPVEIIAPLPRDFRAALAQLRKHGR